MNMIVMVLPNPVARIPNTFSRPHTIDSTKTTCSGQDQCAAGSFMNSRKAIRRDGCTSMLETTGSQVREQGGGGKYSRLKSAMVSDMDALMADMDLSQNALISSITDADDCEIVGVGKVEIVRDCLV